MDQGRSNAASTIQSPKFFKAMIRAVLELLVTIFIVIFARAVFTSIMRGITNASRASSANQPGAAPPGDRSGSSSNPSPRTGGDLHKDPVCGTYVSESTAYRRQTGRDTFFYCSEACKEKHALVSR